MIRAVLVDAMFTLFVPKGGKTRHHNFRDLIAKYTGVEVDLEKLKKVYAAKRKEWEHRLPPNHSQKWTIINREILLELLPGITNDAAERIGGLINTDILTSAELYEVLPSTLEFLEQMRERGIKVLVASNHDPDKLKLILDAFGITNKLDAFYASTEIGAEKPSHEFFRFILHAQNLDPEECVMVGNNPDNDIAGAAASRIRGILYDRENLYESYPGVKVRHLNEIVNYI